MGLGHPLQREMLQHALPARLAVLSAQVGIGDIAPERGLEGRRVGRGNQPTGDVVLDQLRIAANVGGDHRQTGRHGLEDRVGDPLGEGRQGKHVEGLEHARDVAPLPAEMCPAGQIAAVRSRPRAPGGRGRRPRWPDGARKGSPEAPRRRRGDRPGPSPDRADPPCRSRSRRPGGPASAGPPSRSPSLKRAVSTPLWIVSDLPGRNAHGSDEPAPQVEGDRDEARDQWRERPPDPVPPGVEPLGIGRLAPVLAVDHGPDARQTGGEDGVERPPVPGVDDVGPEPAEEPGESGDGPEIDARPLGDAVNRHPGGQAVLRGPPAVMDTTVWRSPWRAALMTLTTPFSIPPIASESSTWTTWITGRATAAPTPRGRAGPRSGWSDRGRRSGARRAALDTPVGSRSPRSRVRRLSSRSRV